MKEEQEHQWSKKKKSEKSCKKSEKIHKKNCGQITASSFTKKYSFLDLFILKIN
jgi:hypothetical protein